MGDQIFKSLKQKYCTYNCAYAPVTIGCTNCTFILVACAALFVGDKPVNGAI